LSGIDSTGSLGGQKKGMNARKGPVTFCSPKSDIQTFLDEVASKPKPGPFLQQFPNGSCLVPTKVFPPFKTCIDLTGYANENISLDLYGRRVVVSYIETEIKISGQLTKTNLGI